MRTQNSATGKTGVFPATSAASYLDALELNSRGDFAGQKSHHTHVRFNEMFHHAWLGERIHCHSRFPDRILIPTKVFFKEFHAEVVEFEVEAIVLTNCFDDIRYDYRPVSGHFAVFIIAETPSELCCDEQQAFLKPFRNAHHPKGTRQVFFRVLQYRSIAHSGFADSGNESTLQVLAIRRQRNEAF